MLELVTIKTKIEQLNKKQQMEILKIIMKMNISHSENNNGVFFNLSSLSQDQISELQKYIEYINDQEDTLQELEDVKNELNETYFNTNGNPIKDNSTNSVVTNEAL
jgi:uncharacterized ferritin-like protein (DUF455 family)